jgi:glycosyltransferase involved in cell wall biosynthesis
MTMNSTTNPSFSFIIPCFNEEDYLEQAVEAIVSNGYPLDKIEILIVDGGSADKSIDIAQTLSLKYGFVKVFDNPRKILAAAWNIGIENASGDCIIAGNAHAKIEKDHFAKTADFLNSHDADCVAPVLVTHPQDNTNFGKAVGEMMCHKFGVGNSAFRTETDGEPQLVDTAHLGAYRKQVFEQGFRYNEEMVRSQDVEIHKRMRLAGKTFLLCPPIKVHYYTRSNPRGFLKFGFLNGYWVTKPMQFGVTVASLRHLVPLVFVSSLFVPLFFTPSIPQAYFVSAIVALLYAVLLAYVAIGQSLLKNRLFYLSLTPLVFTSYHLSYGAGSIAGILVSMSSKRFWSMVRESIMGWLFVKDT